MRDPKRIDDFCDRLKLIWHKYPDLRFGQLLLNLFGKVEKQKGSVFYLEDEQMIDCLESLTIYKEKNPNPFDPNGLR